MYLKPKCKTGQGKTLRVKHRTLSDKNHSELFLDPPPKVMKILKKWHLVKLKSFVQQKKP